MSATKIPQASKRGAPLLIRVMFSIQTESVVTTKVELLNTGFCPVTLTLEVILICLSSNVPLKYNISPSLTKSFFKLPSSSM